MKWLFTAFEPFSGAKTNSSLLALKELEKLPWGQQVVFFAPLPVSFARAWPVLQTKIDEIGPDLGGVVVLGEAASRSTVTLERVALNWIDSKAPDNDGVVMKEGPILPEAPELLWSSIPWPTDLESLGCARSYSAGTFVCNKIMYHLLLEFKNTNRLGGFVHVPLLRSQIERNEVTKVSDAEVLDALTAVVRFVVTL